MSDVVIRIEELSKYYRLGVIGGATLREDLTRWWAKKRGQPDPYAKVDGSNGYSDDEGELWALREVNLDVHEGEILGIVGRNGAGKSTLLKIISRITAPTSGSVKIRGRVGSLLEVGTGFHQELTGRENIYLNGTILGMSRREVDANLEEIVEFAGMAKFIDTPVKRYSSGMTVRLAFAVAAHLEPEILVIDEVLAVGDAAFQKKCICRMGEIAEHGRTILFVSHNMGSVSQLCSDAILLQDGQITMRDTADHVIEEYMSNGRSDMSQVVFDVSKKSHQQAYFERCWVENGEGELCSEFAVGQRIIIGAEIKVNEVILSVEFSMRLYNAKGQPLFTVNYSDSDVFVDRLKIGRHQLRIELPDSLLAPDYYNVHIGLHKAGVAIFDSHDAAIAFHIEETGGNMWKYKGKEFGNILVHCNWSHQQE